LLDIVIKKIRELNILFIRTFYILILRRKKPKLEFKIKTKKVSFIILKKELLKLSNYDK